MIAFFIAVGSIIGVLFPVVNPIGNVFFAMDILKGVETARERHHILVRETAIAFLILLFFLFCGSSVLSILNIAEDSLRITGGALLVIIALPMVFPKPRSKTYAAKEKPFLVPIATPLTAGPSAITMTILLSSTYTHLEMVTALMIMFIFICLFYFCGEFIVKWLGKKGTEAVGRLMGLILVAIAVQMLSTGLVGTVSRLHAQMHIADDYSYVLIRKADLQRDYPGLLPDTHRLQNQAEALRDSALRQKTY